MDYSLSDIKSVLGDGEAGGGLIWLIVLFLFLGGGGNWGRNGDYVSQADLTGALAAQTSAMNQQAILLSSANNNYEVARQIDSLSVNVVQGYNQLAQAIAQLGYNLDQCCCSIKTQMLQDRLQDTQFALNSAQNQISNANQTQYILSQLGKYTPGTTAGA